MECSSFNSECFWVDIFLTKILALVYQNRSCLSKSTNCNSTISEYCPFSLSGYYLNSNSNMCFVICVLQNPFKLFLLSSCTVLHSPSAPSVPPESSRLYRRAAPSQVPSINYKDLNIRCTLYFSKHTQYTWCW